MNYKCIYITFSFFQNPPLKSKVKDGEEKREGNSQESEVRKIHYMIIYGAIVKLTSFCLICGSDSVYKYHDPWSLLSQLSQIILKHQFSEELVCSFLETV